MFIFQKTVDRSTLRQGFQIPVEYHYLLDAMPGGKPKPGETRNIKVLIDGIEYGAQLKNQRFDRTKYIDHPDVIQIRYGEGSPISRRLRELFSESWSYVTQVKALPENCRRKLTISVPGDRQESLAFSSTDIPNVFIADCITVQQKHELRSEVSIFDELDFETFNPIVDETAGYVTSETARKVRKFDRNIGESLKKFYDYRCQMTGERVGNQYDSFVVEAHHIVPFTESMNNDSSNMIILSPTYHRIVHKAKPVWDSKRHAFCYANGLIDKVLINKHL